MLALPFSHLNLRRNPFGEASPEDRAALAVVYIDGIAGKLMRPGFAVQFLGAVGHGKTSHLIALQARLPGAPFVRIDEDRPVDFPAAPLLLVDEAQFLSPKQRARLFRRGASLALGTHLDLERELTAAGLLCETVRLNEVSAERLRNIIERRIEWARRGPGAVPRVVGHERLLARHGSDIRAIERELYDRFQSLPEVGDVQV